jgi:hypothetical protein
MFEQYMKERQGADCIKKDGAFVFYKIQNEECFIVDMFVEKEKRGSSLFSQMISELSELGKNQGCKFLSATIYLNDPGCNHSLKSALKVGFKLSVANNNVLFIIKELSNG